MESVTYLDPNRIDQPFPRLVWIWHSELGLGTMDVDAKLRCLACFPTKALATAYLDQLGQSTKNAHAMIALRSLRCSRVGVAAAVEIAKKWPELHGLVLVRECGESIYRFYR